jgi:hypothetical protein
LNPDDLKTNEGNFNGYRQWKYAKTVTVLGMNMLVFFVEQVLARARL